MKTRKKGVSMRSTRKQKKKTANNMTYEIHWNGSRQFIVEVADGHMSVFRTQDMDGQPMPPKKVFETPFKQIWVPTGGGPEHSGAGDPREVGNTILAHIKGNQYIHVGDGILRILIKEPVLGYYSELINNDIPEPYIYTAKTVYILNDYKVYPKSILVDPTKGVFAPENEGISERKEGLGKKIDIKRINVST